MFYVTAKSKKELHEKTTPFLYMAVLLFLSKLGNEKVEQALKFK
jgi:hypothetical protein